MCLLSGNLIVSRVAISKLYLRHWFWIDLLSTFPFHLVSDIIPLGEGGNSRLPRLLRLTRLMRLMKMFKLLRLSQVVKNLEAEMSGEDSLMMMRLFKLFFFCGLCTHIITCLWHFMHEMNRPQIIEDTGQQSAASDLDWEALNDSDGFPPTWLMGYLPVTWTVATLTTRYFICLYWTITTFTSVGYGDILPQNNSERAYASFAEIVGTVIFATIMGNASTIIAAYGASEQKMRARMDEVNFFCRYGSHKTLKTLNPKKNLTCQPLGSRMEEVTVICRCRDGPVP